MYYDNEKFYNPPLHNGNPGLEGVGGWDVVNPEMNHSIPVQLFPKHVMDLHMNQVDIYLSIISINYTYLYI